MTAPLQVIALSFSREAGSEEELESIEHQLEVEAAKA